MKWLALALLLPPTEAIAQTAGDPDGPPPHLWGVETELVLPFIPTVHILRFSMSRRLWGSPGKLQGDLLVGAYIRPHVVHDVVYTIDEYMAIVGYRQFLWHGLHVESNVYAGVGWGTNRIDQQEYVTPSVFMDAVGGYRFALFRGEKVGLSIAPQGGVLFSLGIADIGPRGGKPDTFGQANLRLGLTF